MLKKGIKIALIGNSATSMINFRGSLIAMLADKGAHVFSLAPDYNLETRNKIRRCGGEPIDFSLDTSGLTLFRGVLEAFGLVTTLRKLNPDVVLCYFLKPAVLGTWASILAGIESRYVLVEGLGYLFGDSSEKVGGFNRLVAIQAFRSALSHVKKVMVLNTDDEKLLLDRKFVISSQLTVIGGIGVDLSYFAVAPPVTNPVHFILVSRLLHEKGIADFASAARIIKADHPTCRFTVLGGLDAGPLGIAENTMRKWVRDGVLEWQEHVNDVRPYLAAASVFVLPSYYREGVPRSSQEALAMARPIITTDNVGCRDTVVEGVNGFLVPVRDPCGLAQAMKRFVIDNSLIRVMGTESRKLAEIRFDERDANQRILNAMGLN